MELLKSLRNISRRKTELWIDGHAKDLSVLGEFTALKELWLYRVSQQNIPVLEALELPKLEILSIRLASFPDLTSISHFNTINTLAIWQCSKLQSLEGINLLSQLRALTLMQNGTIASLEPIASLEHLEKLAIVGGVFAKQKLLSFEPIAHQRKRFKLLDLSGVKLENPDLSPLTRLPEPDEFGISARFYPLEQVAMLAAAYPRWGDQLMALNDNSYSECKKCAGSKKILFKARSRDLCPQCDAAKIEKFLTEFQLLVEEHKNQLGYG
ncbi:MAG: protein phosphatase 1 regulatory subunit 42 [Anaerolineaceae bacterium]|nr:protein phosphatase 1 regulatory subunit 42 [Anaerolineaceae bacterium]